MSTITGGDPLNSTFRERLVRAMGAVRAVFAPRVQATPEQALNRIKGVGEELAKRLVAQFGADQGLVFANQPFRRLFGLSADDVSEGRTFARLLDLWREGGRTPEVRDFPEWRQAHVDWFARAEASEEDWLLRDGTHLHVVAQPTPDGGLLLIAEDRTEQVQLAGARDTLLRVRTATFDNLFEAVAVFAPDGRLHLWNQRRLHRAAVPARAPMAPAGPRRASRRARSASSNRASSGPTICA